MRWFLSAAAALFLVWAWYMGSPYLALWSLATAVERGDGAALAQRVNLYAVRLSLAQQLAAEEIRVAGRQGPIVGAADQQLAGAALAVLGDPIMERLLTSDGTLRLLRSAIEGRDPIAAAPEPADRPGHALRDLREVLGASRWRGFRNVYFSLPPDRPAEQRFRLQLRFSRLAWRLVAVDLPPAIRQRLAKELVRRARVAE